LVSGLKLGNFQASDILFRQAALAEKANALDTIRGQDDPRFREIGHRE